MKTAREKNGKNNPAASGTPSVTPVQNDKIFAIDKNLFPDEIFRNYIKNEIDANEDGYLSTKEINDTTVITVDNMDIANLTGIDVFTNLEKLSCEGNKLITIDISKNHALKSLCASKNRLVQLYMSDNSALQYLDVADNNMKVLDVTKCPLLRELNCVRNDISSLDLSMSTQLETLYCFNNNIKRLSISKCEKLTRCYLEEGINLISDNDKPTAIGIQINAAAFLDDNFRKYVLSEIDTNKDGILTPEEAAAVTEIRTNRMEISNYSGIENFVNLKILDVSNAFPGNTVTVWTLNLSRCPNLEELYCNEAHLRSINVTKNPKLRILMCDGNYEMSTLDVTNNPELYILHCANNHLSQLDISNNPELYELFCNDNMIQILDISKNKKISEHRYGKGVKLIKSEDQLSDAGIAIDVDNFPDVNFRVYIKENMDVDKNGVLSDLEIKSIKKMDFYNEFIIDFTGLEFFTELVDLKISDCRCSKLDLSSNTKLETLNCDFNYLTELNVSGNKKLKKLSCAGNRLKTIDVSKNAELESFACENNELTELDVSNNEKLTYLSASQNEALTKIIISWKTIGKDVDFNADSGVFFEANNVPAI